MGGGFSFTPSEHPTSRIYFGALDSGRVKRLTAAETSGVYMPDGWVLWVRGSTLVAQRLDLDREELVGNQVAIADPAGFDSTSSLSAVSVSGSGLIAYRAESVGRRQLTWFDRAGNMLRELTPPDETGLMSPRLSPDDRRVTGWRTVEGNSDIWVLDGTRLSRFTFDATLDRYPIWSADGSRIVFDSTREGVRQLYEKPASGAGSEQLLLESSENSENNVASSSSRNGRFLSYSSQRPKTGWDIGILPMERERKPWPFLATSFNERSSHFSPDGHWLAYASDESGRYEVYVRPFTDPEAAGAGENRNGGQWQVSTSGGLFPRWSADGKELFYVAPDGRMMGVPISATAETLAPGTPEPLFVRRMYGGGTSPDVGRQYDVTSDGRFLINMVVDETAAPITILQNWKPPVE